MAGLQEIIAVGERNTLHFGNYEVAEKQKLDGFEVGGDLYKIKTHTEITRLEKNGRLLYESVPGTTVRDFKYDGENLLFHVESDKEDAQITVELEAEASYIVFINQVKVGKVDSNLAGKISFSVDFATGTQEVELKKA